MKNPAEGNSHRAGARRRPGRAGRQAAAAASALRLFELLPDVCYFTKDTRGRFLDANRQFAEMMGARRVEEIIGRTDYDFSPRKLADAFAADDRQVMTTGEEIIDRVELVPHADGTICWHTTSKVPLRDGNGRITGLAGITRNLHKASTTLRPFRELAAVLDHIESRYSAPVAVRELAELAHLSVSQLERKFRSLFNVTPMAYLLRIRINRACHLLAETDAKITAIAAQCGFYDHSHFNRQFTRLVGMSPRAYRRERTLTKAGLRSR